MTPKLLTLLCMGSLVVLGACATDEATGCAQDADCKDGFICRDSVCLCTTNDSCEVGEYCNTGGSCQKRPPCIGNQDCKAGEICNSADVFSGGSCIAATQCGSGVHCPFNHYCNASGGGAGVCEPGCRSTGDCQLGYVCAAGQCIEGTTSSDCSECSANPMPDPTYCDYGEVCTPVGHCVDYTQRSNLCGECDEMFGPTCTDKNICLIDDEGTGNYCAPSCETDFDCPAGFAGGCHSLSIVMGECDGMFGSEGPCECTNSPCAGARKCERDPESNRGFCECLGDSDCATMGGTCSGGRCTGTDLPCDNSTDCAVTCVQTPALDGSMYGHCLTASKACGKETGLSCDTIKNGTAECRNY